MPKTGQKHRFTETPPRIVAQIEDQYACPECQTTLEVWEGKSAPRLYGFTAKDVAWALTQVSVGATYRGTAAAVRERAGRALATLGNRSQAGRLLPAATQHGQLVSDWVDVFAPVIWDAYAPGRWPGEVLLDDTLMKYTDRASGLSGRAFYVFAVMAYTPTPRRFVAAIEASPRATNAAWVKFLATLPGQPRWAVTDGGVTARAAAKQWPDAEMWRCEWHLRQNLATKLPDAVRNDPSDPLNGHLMRAQVSEEHWQTYLSELSRRSARESGFRGALTAATRLSSLITDQAFRRPDDDLPRSTGPLEQFFHNQVGPTIGDRAARMTNKRRADALLKLIAACRNGWADESVWTRIIREHLEKQRGHPAQQRQHIDPRTKPSLR